MHDPGVECQAALCPFLHQFQFMNGHQRGKQQGQSDASFQDSPSFEQILHPGAGGEGTDLAGWPVPSVPLSLTASGLVVEVCVACLQKPSLQKMHVKGENKGLHGGESHEGPHGLPF